MRENFDDGMNNDRERPGKKRGFFASTAWKILRPVTIVIAALVVVFFVFSALYNYIEDRYMTPVDPGSTEIIEIEIPKSSSLTAISEILEENGLVKSSTAFKFYADFSDMSYKLRAGKYRLSPSMTYDDIMATLMMGNPPPKEVSFTFVEGSTVDTEAAQLTDRENGGIWKDAGEFLSQCKTGEKFDRYSFVQEVIENHHDGRINILDGYLFPDTYRYYADAAPEDIITKQLDRFSQIFTPDYVIRAEELGMTTDEVITLASIIEREAVTADFKKVSAVFHNRLDSGMILGSCATMQVVTGVNKYTFTEEEKAIDSPYNTYKYAGLPAGPICNPGAAAIEAALYPDQEYIEEGYLFFCLTDPKTGLQAFAKTQKEHDRNIAEWSALWQ